MLLGNIGAEQRYEYRAVGDIVNTASRIQGLNQLLGTRVLVSAATLADVELPARDVGTFLLRGKRLPVRVLEPTGAGCRLDEHGLAAFAAALAAFRRGDWQDAHDGFAALSRRFPGDGPSRYYEALSLAMRSSPPDDVGRRRADHDEVGAAQDSRIFAEAPNSTRATGSRARERGRCVTLEVCEHVVDAGDAFALGVGLPLEQLAQHALRPCFARARAPA